MLAHDQFVKRELEAMSNTFRGALSGDVPVVQTKADLQSDASTVTGANGTGQDRSDHLNQEQWWLGPYDEGSEGTPCSEGEEEDAGDPEFGLPPPSSPGPKDNGARGKWPSAMGPELED